MFIKLLLLFTVVPFVELILLIKIGTVIGTFDTVMLIIITGVIGAVMVRSAGVQCLFRIQSSLNSGVVPTEELFTGVLILISGAFLLTPGLITDAAGFVLLFPPARETIKGFLIKYIKSRIDQRKSGSHIDIQL
jgi:UPF0716 protein FxsA